ncbi:TRAP transporter small permease [Microbacterium sp. zg.Y625]|uniref:TRAP transporter small permease subunit n=1 Tax=Microbacterium jiangjiandongii TaxID=3049071 RepID=UPI00214AF87E|nr:MULTISPECIES: TRAP transporter small permease [unclassified Microbacterium]MCR2793481.1 TRAP transporter small permease [Microbacterium sp. zg.Y625]MCR2815341.1 TRAP transporter small permease [Microbacterium sp. zg.Y843]WIM25152.1 TRAP transporter small permease [Microbacterium sp. zg-Y625]
MSDTDAGSAADVETRRLPLAIRVVDRLSDIAGTGAAIALALLTLNVIVDVVARTLFGRPLAGTLELTTYWWMPGLVLLSFPYAERLQEHIKVTMVLEALPLPVRRIVEGTIAALVAALLAALAVFTLQDALASAALGQTTNSNPPIAVWPFKFVAVAGIALLALQSAATSFRFFSGRLPRRDALLTEADVL